MRPSSSLLVLSFLLLCAGCGSVPEVEPVQNGAFTLSDGGEGVGFERYRLSLPEPLDLDRAQVIRRELEWCPSAGMVAYLDLDLPLPADSAEAKESSPWAATIFELRLEGPDGRVIFGERAPLREWTWSGAVGGATTSLYTPGTCFDSAGEGPFTLVAEVVPAAGGAPSGTLGLRGGGWKAEGKPMPMSALLR